MTEFLYRDASGQTQRKDVDYAELINVPADFPATPHTHDWTTDITGKPATFPPDVHTHNHGDLGDLTFDDHPQYHTDARGDARYSLLGHDHDAAYSPLGHVHVHATNTGLGADDHPQYYDTARGDARWSSRLHNLYGFNHPDIDSAGPLLIRHLLASDNATTFFPEYRNNWLGLWVPATYERSDVVLDTPYLMIANKQTTDRAGPQPLGQVEWLSGFGDTPPWLTPVNVTSTMFTGQRYTVPVGAQLHGYRIWIPVADATVDYALWLIEDPLTAPSISVVLPRFNATTTGWRTVPVVITPLTVGAVFDLVLVQHNNDTPTLFASTWAQKNVNGDPLSGEATFFNNQVELRIHHVDAGAVNRQTSLESIAVGAALVAAGVTWTVTAKSNQADHVRFTLAPTGQRPAEADISYSFTWGTPTPITYVRVTDHYIANDDVEGFISLDGTYPAVTLDNDAYGVDVLVDELILSPDWDIMSLAGGSGGASIGEPFPEAPVDGETYGRKGDDASWQTVYTQTEADTTFAAAIHTHVEADITDLQNYSLVGHTHVEADITDLQNYSLVGHNHDAAYAPLVHTHVEADITDLQNYSLVGHTHGSGDLVFPLLAPDSSSGAPAYSWANFPTEGFYHHASQTKIYLSVGSTAGYSWSGSFFEIYAGRHVRHYGTTSGYLNTSHNNTNYLSTFSATTDWTITGLIGKADFGSIPIEAGRFTSASNSQTTIIDFYATANGNFGAVNGMNFYCDTGNANTSDSFRWWANAVGNGSADLLMTLNQQGGLELATVRIEGTGDVGLTSTAHGFQIGPTTGVNLAMDGNEIMARNNSAASPLYINHEGGQVYLNGGRLIVDTGSIISTQVFRGPNGTAGLPPYSFSGDTNTGMYWISADRVGWATAGVLRFDASTSQIRSTLPFRGPNGSVSAPTYSFTGDTDTGWYLVTTSNIGMALAGVQKISCGTSAFSVLTPLWVQDGTAALPSLTFASDNNTGMFRQAADKLGFTTAGGERLRLSSTGITAYTKLLMNNNEIQASSSNTRVKYTVWNNGIYSIGMGASYTLGSVATYCMTFQMGTVDTYGFWWGKSSHTNAQGAMTLSNSGHLYVLSSIEVGGSEVWHAGNDGSGSGLDADLLDGKNSYSGYAPGANVIPIQNSSGDHFARLYRTNYTNQTSMATAATMCFRVNAASDNYIRHCTAAGVVAWLNTQGGLEADPVGGPFLPLSGGLMAGTLSLQGTGGNSFKNGTGDGASYTVYNFAFQGWQGMAMQDHANVVHGVYNFRSGFWYVDRGYLIKNDGTSAAMSIAWDSGFGTFIDGNVWRFNTTSGIQMLGLDPVSSLVSLGMTTEVNGRVRVGAAYVTPISALELTTKQYSDATLLFAKTEIEDSFNNTISNTAAAPPDPTGVTATLLGNTIWTAAWDEEGLGVFFEIEIDVGGGGFVADRFTRGGMFVYGKTNPQSAQFRVRAHSTGGGVSNWVNSAVI